MKGEARMVDVGPKRATARRAVARGSLRMSLRAFGRLKAGTLPKGDPFPLAQAAGLSSAKRTAEAIPLCHPLPLDQVRVWLEADASLPGVHAFCEARATAKTGVEMEALSGVSGALLAVWDGVKAVDPALDISHIHLVIKEGGKSGVWKNPASRASVERRAAKPPRPWGRGAVITVSDRCAQGKAQDLSGPAAAAGLRAMGLKTGKPLVVADERPAIEGAIRRRAASADVVLLAGGTGLGPRDVTPEAVAAVCDRLIAGIGEALRAAGAGSTPLAALSRSAAGQLGRSIVVALPGSRGGVADGLAVLEALLPHAVHVARGGDHPRP